MQTLWTKNLKLIYEICRHFFGDFCYNFYNISAILLTYEKTKKKYLYK